MKILDPLVAHLFTGSTFDRVIRRENANERLGAELIDQLRVNESLTLLRIPLMDAFMLCAEADHPDLGKLSTLYATAKIVDGIRGVRCMNERMAQTIQNSSNEGFENSKDVIRGMVSELEKSLSFSIQHYFVPSAPFEDYVLILKALVDAVSDPECPSMKAATRATSRTVISVLPEWHRVALPDLRALVARDHGYVGPKKESILRSLTAASEAVAAGDILKHVNAAFVAVQTSSLSAKTKRYADFVMYDNLKTSVRDMTRKCRLAESNTSTVGIFNGAVRLGVALLRLTMTGLYPDLFEIPVRLKMCVLDLHLLIPPSEHEARQSLKVLADLYDVVLPRN